MTEPPVPPRALDALAGAIGKARATPGAAPGESTFGWVPGSGAPATIGRFRIVAPIGRGGMGVVYEAIDPLTNKGVALKSLAAGPASRMTREGEAIGRLDHAAIVPVLETGEELGRPFLVMELVQGQALDDAWAGWDLRRRVEALKVIAEALAHAHGRGVAHRDLKPSNVLLGKDGAPRVTDFGLAAVEGDLTKLTDPGTVMGTPAWMAPEQVKGEDAGPPADVHALGALLYLALTGAAPFDGPNPPAIYRRIVDEDAAWPRRRDAGVPAALEAVCLAALRKAPRERPTAGEFATDLGRWLAGQPVLARLPSVTQRLMRVARRNPAAWIGAGVAIVAVAAGAVAVWMQASRGARRDRARDLVRDAQPLASQALLALSAGDDAAAARLMADFERTMARARALDPAAAGGWFEIAEYRRLTGDEAGAATALRQAPAGDPLALLEEGLLAVAAWRRAGRIAAREAAASAATGGPSEAGADLRARLDADARRAGDLLDRAIAGLGGQAPPSARIAKAELALLQGRPADAESLVRDLEPPEAKVVAGQAAEARGDLENAVARYGHAIATRARHWPAWEARAAARERIASLKWKPGQAEGEGDQADAVTDWKHLAESLSRRADLHLSLSAALSRLGQMRLYRGADPTEPFSMAVTAARAARDADPAGGDPRLAAGRALAGLADWRFYRTPDPSAEYVRAIAEFEAAAAMLPRPFEARLGLAHAFRMLAVWKKTSGKPDFADAYERAIHEFDRVAALDPTWLAARSNQGILYCELGRWPEAVKAFEAAGRWATDEPAVRARFEEAKRRAAGEER